MLIFRNRDSLECLNKDSVWWSGGGEVTAKFQVHEPQESISDGGCCRAGGDLHLSGGAGTSWMGAPCIVLVSAHHNSAH